MSASVDPRSRTLPHARPPTTRSSSVPGAPGAPGAFARLPALVLAATLALAATAARAGCDVPGGELRLLSDDWEALNIVAERAEACAGEGLRVETERTREHKALQVAALGVEPARYTSVIVSNNTVVPLLNEDLIRPLDALVERHAPELPERQRIRVDGRTMAIAFNANVQHLYYREDLLAEANLAPPSSYAELLDAARILRERGVERPLGGTFAAGWDLANEFMNLYLGLGGEPFGPDGVEPAIEGPAGVEALGTLRALSGYMDPDFLSIDSNELQSLWESGEVAMAVGWSSRAEALLDVEGDAPEVAVSTRVAAAPTIGRGDGDGDGDGEGEGEGGEGTVPAAALWWNGFAIARNASDEDAEASFRIMLHAISPDLLEEHADAALWLVEGYAPTPASAGALATIEAGAVPYPMLAPMSLLHAALGDELAEFLRGDEGAGRALADAAAAYRAAARERGFIE